MARRRRWLFAAAMALTALTLALRIDFPDHGVPSVTLLALEAPALFAPLAVAALIAWILYWRVSRAVA
jgi:hypothetical protein